MNALRRDRPASDDVMRAAERAPEALRILFLEDVQLDIELQLRELQRAGLEVQSRRTQKEEDFTRELESFAPDVILSDFTLPGFDGMRALEIAKAKCPDAPFIFVSGTIGEERAIESLRQGATDYVIKSNLGRLGPAVKRAVAEKRERAARQAAERELEASERRFRLFMDHFPGAAFMKSADGRYAFANRRAAAIFGLKDDADPGLERNLSAQPNAEPAAAPDERAPDAAIQSEHTIAHDRGASSWLTTEFALAHEDGAAPLIGGISIDITARVEAEKALQLRDRAIEASKNPIVITDCTLPDMPLVYVNPAFERVTGYRASEVLGRNCRFLQGTDHDQPALERVRTALREGHETQVVLRNYRKDGQLFLNELHLSPVREGDGGRVTHFVGVQYDITKAMHYQEELEYRASHDVLTGLANRHLLNDRLQHAIEQGRRNASMVTVVFIDIDHFKRINDTRGHSAGDAVLRVIAERLQHCVRSDDTLGRMGGDEFVMILNAQSLESSGYRVVQRVVDAIAQPMLVDGRELKVTCSIGLSSYPQDGLDAASLLRTADAALFRAKEQGRNTFQFYGREVSKATSERVALESDLQDALERGQFVLHYQPQIELATGRIAGLEALLRWRHPKYGLVEPARFIPLAEESGLIIPIGAWVLRTASAQNRAFQEAGLPPVRMAVNVSARQLREHHLHATVAEALQDASLAPRWLELELTESSVLHDIDETAHMLQPLVDLGVQISIDDFGIGYSSLSYLRRLPVHRLKIDRSFVRDLATNADDATIAQTVIAMGHGLGLVVTAEGVESAAPCDFLRARGCDEAQGYFLGSPMPGEDVQAVLEQATKLFPAVG
jgi:diguanylate cyclase (GGDEF)-like protein/PAS domain S-box-containing protein